MHNTVPIILMMSALAIGQAYNDDVYTLLTYLAIFLSSWSTALWINDELKTSPLTAPLVLVAVLVPNWTSYWFIITHYSILTTFYTILLKLIKQFDL